jgi:hypothetical protein
MVTDQAERTVPVLSDGPAHPYRRGETRGKSYLVEVDELRSDTADALPLNLRLAELVATAVQSDDRVDVVGAYAGVLRRSDDLADGRLRRSYRRGVPIGP